MLRESLLYAVLCLSMHFACARNLAQAPAAEVAAPPAGEAPATAVGSKQYATFAEAFATASSNKELSILTQAVNAAGLKVDESAAWTILAPLDQDFKVRLKEDFQLTPAAFLDNKDLVTKVLSYHVIPSAALTTDQLTEGKALTTALAGAPPLVVQFDRTYRNGTTRPVPQIEIRGATNKAELRSRGENIRAGNSVIHLINDVLIPSGVKTSGNITAQGP